MLDKQTYTDTEILGWLQKKKYQTEQSEQEYKLYFDIDMPKIINEFILDHQAPPPEPFDEFAKRSLAALDKALKDDKANGWAITKKFMADHNIRHNTDPIEDLVPIPEPIGNYIINNIKGTMGIDGVYYHYRDVCEVLHILEKDIQDKKIEELEEWLRSETWGFERKTISSILVHDKIIKLKAKKS